MGKEISIAGSLGFGIVLLVMNFIEPTYTQVTILDVGQGSGAYIQTEEGFEVLIDVGETNKTLRNLGIFRSWWDRDIDMLITSHSDKDHTGMAPRVLRRFRVGHYIESPKPGANDLHTTIHKDLITAETIKLGFELNQTIFLGEGVSVTFLHPDSESSKKYSDNDASLIILVEVQELSFLFMGDASSKVEQELIQIYGDELDVDVLVVGHHGSKTSTSQEFLSATKPAYGVISAGADNRYGHPHQSVIKRLEENGVVILRTDELGNIQFRIYKDQDFDIMVR